MFESSDNTMFLAILRNPDHVLHFLLPPPKTTGHDLRKRASRLDTNSNAVESCEKELHTTNVVQRHLLTLCVCVYSV